MNWFTKTSDTFVPITDIIDPSSFSNPEAASHYQVAFYDSNEIAVINRNGQEIKRREHVEDDFPLDEVSNRVINEAVKKFLSDAKNRINFIESSYVVIRYKVG